MPRTPYDILGVARDCTQEEIKQAYRLLAKQYHPDSNMGDPAAQKRFLEISDAYQALGTAQKRKLWDLMNPPSPFAVATAAKPATASAPPPEAAPAPATPPADSGSATPSSTSTASAGVDNNTTTPPGLEPRAKRPASQPHPARRYRPQRPVTASGEEGGPPRSEIPARRKNLWKPGRHAAGLMLVIAAVGVLWLLLEMMRNTAEHKQSSPRSAPQVVIVPLRGKFTEAAIEMLAKQSKRLDAVVTRSEEDKKSDEWVVEYRYKDLTGQEFSDQCHPCAYDAAEKLKAGDAIKIMHLPGKNLSAPLFVFEDLDRVEESFVERVNQMASATVKDTTTASPSLVKVP